MIRNEDEFNQVNINNGVESSKNEFAQNKDAEFSFQRDNSLPKDEYSSKDEHINGPSKNKGLKETTEKLVKSSGETVLSSSVTASNAAAISTSAVVAASTVAVVVIGTVTGISVALHDYDYKFNLFSISANELTYELLIIDNNKKEEDFLSYEDFENRQEEEEQPFTLRVFNSNYDYSHSLWLGYNYNTFEGLKLGETYNIVLSESRYGGETLFSESFTTFENTKFYSFSIPGSANFIDHTFEVEMSFVDNSQSFSDFTLYLEDAEYPEEVSVVYNLEPISGIQTISTDLEDTGYINLERTYNYRFSYKDKGETVDYSEGTVSFYDTSGAITSFNSIDIETNVDFLSDEFVVTLDYEDPLEHYYSFILELDEPELDYPISVYLDHTTEPQSININNYGIDFDKTYNYRFLYYTEEDEIEFEVGTISFTDYLGRETRYDGITMSANHATAEITITLSYVDDFEFYDNFVLTLTSADGADYVIDLDATTDAQVINARGYGITFDKSYTYQLTVDYKGTNKILEDSDEAFTFTDDSDGEGTFTSIDFIGDEASYSNRSFYVKLNYKDSNDILSDFVLVLLDNDNNNQLAIPLDKTLDPQLVMANETENSGVTGAPEYKVDIVLHTITYQVTYQKSNGEETETISVPETPVNAVKFTNSDFKELKTTTVKNELGSTNYTLGMMIDYVDGASEYDTEIYSDWHLVFNNGESDICDIILTNDNHVWEWHEYELNPLGDSNLINSILDTTCSVVIYVNIYDVSADVYSSEVEVYRNEIILKDDNNVNAEIFGVVLDPYVVSGIYTLTVQDIVYAKTFSYYDDCQLRIVTEDETVYTYDFDLEENYFTINLTAPIEGNYAEEKFYADLSKPVEVAILYSIYVESTDGASPGMVKQDHDPLICYQDYQFIVQV